VLLVELLVGLKFTDLMIDSATPPAPGEFNNKRLAAAAAAALLFSSSFMEPFVYFKDFYF
jgi:hypothetical protein